MAHHNFRYGPFAILAVVAGGQALAQTAPAPANGALVNGGQTEGTAQSPDATPAPVAGANSLGEIVVTARKFAENLQKTPASVVAVSGAALEQRGIVMAEDLEKFLPSTSLRQLGSATQVFIRGIGTRNTAPNFAAASAFVFNGIIIPSYGTFGLTQDLDSVQSIAGPQGTLYGGSAAGGAINLFSARPHGNYDGHAAVEYGNYDAWSVTADQNVALSDTLSARIAANYNLRNKSYFRDNLATDNNWSGRLSVLYKPTQDVTALIFYNHGKDDGKPPIIVTPIGIPDPSHPYALPATFNFKPVNGAANFQNNRNDVVGANIDFKIGDNAFTYIPGYVNLTANYQYFGGLTFNQFHYYDHERQHSEELRWNRRFGQLQLNAGLFYLRDLTAENLHLLINVPFAYVPVTLNVTSQVNESYAAYAQGIYSLSDKLRLTVGGRYSHDKIDATGTGATGNAIDFHHGHGRGDYKVGVDYDLARRVLLYGNVQTGYIPFGYDPDVTPNPILPESRLFAVSGGVKSRFFGNRLEVNVEGFHYDYTDFQAITFNAAVPPGVAPTTVLDAHKAEIYGADISARAQATPTTQLNASVVLLSAKYTQFAGRDAAGNPYDYTGHQMINAPHANVIAGIEQTVKLGSFGDLVARVDTHYSASYFGNYTNVPTSRQDAYTKTDASITYRPPGGRFSVQGFVRNIENNAVFTVLTPATGQGPTGGVGGLEAPRTYGIRGEFTW